MNAAAAVFVVSAITLAGGCGGDPGAISSSNRPSAVTTPFAEDVRAGVPTVAGDDRSGLPRVDGNDAAPPQLTTRTTVLENHRPALVVTLTEAVLFPFGSAELRPEAEASLHGVVALLGQHAGAAAEVAGHTDSVGSAEYNRALSQQRAAAVVDWLVDRGVPRALLRPVGYGATRPVAGNTLDEERRRNRRVEITVETPEKERRR